MNRLTNRRTFLGTLGRMGALSAASAMLPRVSEAQEKRPNILFIMSDDHAVNAIRCYGSRLAAIAPTPNIDRLGQEGMMLRRCFCTNSICVPSRASILTGTYSHINQVYTLNDALDPTRIHVATLLQQSGYQTAMIGKWHLHKDPSGFDYWNILPGQGRYANPVLKEIGGRTKTYSGHSTDVITDLSLEWLTQREPEQPFFLMCHFKAPHEPWDNADRLDDYLQDVEIPEPESLWEDKSHRSPGSREYGFTIDTMAERQTRANYHSDGPVSFDGLDEKERRKKAYQVFLKRYLRTITGVDQNVGRLLEYLDTHNLAENTVVIYTSDQGYFLGEHNYIDKRWMFEESLTMPFLIRYPGEIQPKSVNSDIVLNVDFAPTFLDYAGIQPPPDMQGRSIRALSQGKTPSDWRTSMYYRYWMHTNRPAHYGIRTKQYKLIFYYGLPLGMTGTQSEPSKPGWEFYDLEADPHELQNLYTHPDYQPVIQALKKELRQKKIELGDTDDPYPDLLRVINQTEQGASKR